jgi:hypothetical protein
MNSNCEYCRAPDRYGLLPATEVVVLATRYEDDPDPTSTYRHQITEEVLIEAHLVKHPIRDIPDFHIPCRPDVGAFKQ